MVGRFAVAPHRFLSAAAPRWPLALFLALMMGLVALPGCSGCRKSPSAAKKQKQEEEEKKRRKENEKPKPDYELAQVRTYPNDADQVQNFVKPGHWVTVTQQLRANNFDFQADLELAATDNEGRPYRVEETDFQVTMSRPAALPKGQIKTFEMTMYVPRVPQSASPTEARKVWFESRLRALRGGNKVGDSREGTTDLDEFCYFFVVLARQPNNYRFLKVLDTVTPPAHGADSGRLTHYRVILPKVTEFVAIPSHPLTWTSIAYVLWDEVDPQSLTPDQQTALVDWLHWGGQLIINGPGSLEQLQRSFLADYLPAERLQAVELGVSELAELNDFYSLPSVKEPTDDRRLSLKKDQPLLGIQWRVHPSASVVDYSGGLLCERRVGAGRIVATALPLDDPAIREWKSFDNFLHNCLLRRPARNFQSLANIDDRFAQPLWVGLDKGLANDPRLCSTIRYFTRDIGHLVDARSATSEDRDENQEATNGLPPQTKSAAALPAYGIRPGDDEPRINPAIYTDNDDWRFRGATTDRLSGVGGWNDSSGATLAVRDAIKEAAGIKIPEAPFVLKLLAIYLVVLVPANWALFRLMGRVEWAWAAVPLIAIAGAVSVIRLAQLDIGFVRSRREVAVLELQGGYPRGHLTRYSLLYSSLSTDYDVTFQDGSALAQPLAKPSDAPRTRSDRSIQVRRDEHVQLRNFLVRSNSTELLHSEHMFPMNGALELEGDDQAGWELVNGGDLELRDVGVVRRTDTGEFQAAWVGQLGGKSRIPLTFQPTGDLGAWVGRWNDSPTTARQGPAVEGEIRLGRLFELAVRKMALGPGDIRLVGWTEQDLSGVAFHPGSAQTTTRTLTLCHLRRGKLPAIGRDANVRTDFFAPKAETGTEEEAEVPPPAAQLKP